MKQQISQNDQRKIQKVLNEYQQLMESIEKITAIVEKFVKGLKEEKANILMDKAEELACSIKKENEISNEAGKLKKKSREISKICYELSSTSKHQIRKHYHRLLDIKERLKAEDADITEFYPEIAMTAAYATYDRSRGNIGVTFETFLKEFTNRAIKSDKDEFFELMTLFEAIVAYASMYIN
ncbi:type III-A CRISPR-associated protein Csm2 [Desulfurobacterium sp.]